MWDALFAIDPTLELVDMISIAMLLRIRWQLLASDINESFSMLLRYPEPDSPAYTFIKDALYLRDNLTPEGGAEIITRYGQQAPKIEARSPPTIRAPSPSPSSSSNRTRQGIASPRSVIQQGVGFEALLQGAAKGVLERGSQWGVGKVIRDAVGEVRKNVEAYQSGPVSLPSTPRSGGREYRKPGQIATTGAMNKPGLERTMSGNMIRKMEGQERRNKGLAKMLDTAVAELWDYHKERSEAGDIKDNKDSMEMLSLAIAKVQFVQVYLEDSSIPLPPDDQSIEQPSGPGTPNLLTPTPASPMIPERTSSAPPIANAYPKPLPSASASATPQPLENNKEPAQLLSPLDRRPSATPASASSSLPPRSRPMLTSSNFSWMLGQESTPSTFVSGTAHTAFPSDEKRRMRGSISGKGFLFGDEDDEGNEKEGKKKKTKDKKNGKKDTEVEEEVIDLEDVGSRAVF
jgi:TBC1 domain family protein 5